MISFRKCTESVKKYKTVVLIHFDSINPDVGELVYLLKLTHIYKFRKFKIKNMINFRKCTQSEKNYKTVIPFDFDSINLDVDSNPF